MYDVENWNLNVKNGLLFLETSSRTLAFAQQFERNWNGGERIQRPRAGKHSIWWNLKWLEEDNIQFDCFIAFLTISFKVIIISLDTIGYLSRLPTTINSLYVSTEQTRNEWIVGLFSFRKFEIPRGKWVEKEDGCQLRPFPPSLLKCSVLLALFVWEMLSTSLPESNFVFS